MVFLHTYKQYLCSRFALQLSKLVGTAIYIKKFSHNKRCKFWCKTTREDCMSAAQHQRLYIVSETGCIKGLTNMIQTLDLG